jgi:hypothetical protein
MSVVTREWIRTPEEVERSRRRPGSKSVCTPGDKRLGYLPMDMHYPIALEIDEDIEKGS